MTHPPSSKILDVSNKRSLSSQNSLKSWIVNLTDPVFRGKYHGRKKHDGKFRSHKGSTITENGSLTII